MDEVLQKFMAASGYCSRRQAEPLIRAGKVRINGHVAEIGARVKTGDEVRVSGKILRLLKDKIYIKLNKPAGFTCTNRKFKNEKNIFDLIKVDVRLFAVGRLDKDSRGLVLLTNDGDLANRITHPRYSHEKEYIVLVNKIDGSLNDKIVADKFRQGVNIGADDGMVKVKDIKYLGGNKFKIVLTEGKKRQIRRMFKSLGLNTVDLERTAIGNLRLGGLKEGEWEKLDESGVKKLINN